jgi:hypothetical protein
LCRRLGARSSAAGVSAVVAAAVLADAGAARQVQSPANATGMTASAVAVVDDSVRITRRPVPERALLGHDNALWSPGGPIRLFGLPGETLAFQVVVEAGSESLQGVTVQLSDADPSDSLGAAGVVVDRFVVSEVQVTRRSGGIRPRESLGWTSAAMPVFAAPASVPDPLIPVEHAPAWADYPMSVAPGERRVVWFDIAIPAENLAPGTYRGALAVRGAHAGGAPLVSDLDVHLEVGAVALPYASARTMVYFDPAELLGRIEDPGAVQAHLQLMHGHHISPITRIVDGIDVDQYADWLTGAMFRPERGYFGPGQGRGADVVALGAYGALGAPSPAALQRVASIVTRLEALGIRDEPGVTDVFLYAIDEECDNPVGEHWKRALEDAGLAGAVRVAHTCSRDPALQPVDIAMVLASEYAPADVRRAEQHGKRVWLYNGVLPHTGSFLTDADGQSLRANGWIQEMYGVERWFYWESTFWNDDNRGGQGPYDPLRTAETFHNQHGDHCNGDGVLVYPGRQSRSGWHSAGYPGVFPSIRLKQWRRGLSDAGYLAIARQVAPEATGRIARALIPAALDGAKGRRGASWPLRGAAFGQARRELFELIRSASAVSASGCVSR